MLEGFSEAYVVLQAKKVGSNKGSVVTVLARSAGEGRRAMTLSSSILKTKATIKGKSVHINFILILENSASLLCIKRSFPQYRTKQTNFRQNAWRPLNRSSLV